MGSSVNDVQRRKQVIDKIAGFSGFPGEEFQQHEVLCDPLHEYKRRKTLQSPAIILLILLIP
jgi:hypothetical protein